MREGAVRLFGVFERDLLFERVVGADILFFDVVHVGIETHFHRGVPTQAHQFAVDPERVEIVGVDQGNKGPLRRFGIDRLEDSHRARRLRLVHQHRPEFVEHPGEDERVAFRKDAFQPDRHFLILGVDVDQVEQTQDAQRPFVEGNGAPAEDRGNGVTFHKGSDVADRSQVVAERLFPLFAPLLKIEFIRRLKDDLEGLAEPLAAVARIAERGNQIAQLACGRDAQLVPVDERVFDRFKRLQGDGGRTVFEKGRVDQLDKDLPVIGQRDDARTKLLLQVLIQILVCAARRRSHKNFLL